MEVFITVQLHEWAFISFITINNGLSVRNSLANTSCESCLEFLPLRLPDFYWLSISSNFKHKPLKMKKKKFN